MEGGRVLIDFLSGSARAEPSWKGSLISPGLDRGSVGVNELSCFLHSMKKSKACERASYARPGGHTVLLFSSCSVSLGHLSVTRYIEQLRSSKRESDRVIGAGIDRQEEKRQDRLGGRFNGTSNLSSITVITLLTLLPKGTTGSDLSDYP